MRIREQARPGFQGGACFDRCGVGRGIITLIFASEPSAKKTGSTVTPTSATDPFRCSRIHFSKLARRLTIALVSSQTCRRAAAFSSPRRRRILPSSKDAEHPQRARNWTLLSRWLAGDALGCDGPLQQRRRLAECYLDEDIQPLALVRIISTIW